MESIDYIGLDLHKKSIAYCVKTQGGQVLDEGSIPSTKDALNAWASERRRPWVGAMEATLFTGWVYDELEAFALDLNVAHPLMLTAITASKKKSDPVDASMLADLLRCDLLPECYMPPAEIRQLRRVLRFRNLILQQAVRMKNKIAGLLMEVGQPYNKQKLHGKRYFGQLLDSLDDVRDSVIELLRMSRGALELFEGMQKQLIAALRDHPQLRERVARLMTIPRVGQVTALTWALEVGDPARFSSLRKAISYCGLCSALDRLAAGPTGSLGQIRAGPALDSRPRIH